MKCNKCQRPMHKVGRREEMAELSEDATDGQMADYFAAELSGDNGVWNLGIVEYFCAKCVLVVQVVSDQLPSHYPLIEAWHEKAAEGDTFSRFVFQYLAFIAHVKNNLFYDVPNDRLAIQRLKRDSRIKSDYINLVMNDVILHQVWNQVLTELQAKPLYNVSADPDYPEIDKWWNSIGDRPDMANVLPMGRIHSHEDWSNMVEFWYSVRNNLFHGGKNLNERRDAFLVETAFQTLRPLIEIELRNI